MSFTKRKDELDYVQIHDNLIGRIEEFIASYHSDQNDDNIQYTSNAIEKVMMCFKSYLNRVMGQMHTTRFNRYKIASLMELSIVKVCPISCSKAIDDKLRKKLNAQFAMALSIGLVGDFMEKDDREFKKILPAEILGHKAPDLCNNYLRDHLDWLRFKNGSHFPVFKNSHFLSLLFVTFGYVVCSKSALN